MAWQDSSRPPTAFELWTPVFRLYGSDKARRQVGLQKCVTLIKRTLSTNDKLITQSYIIIYNNSVIIARVRLCFVTAPHVPCIVHYDEITSNTCGFHTGKKGEKKPPSCLLLCTWTKLLKIAAESRKVSLRYQPKNCRNEQKYFLKKIQI